MFNNIRRLKSLKRKDRKNDATISELNVYCDCIENALSPFCSKEAPIINSELADYLENSAEKIPLENDIHININGDVDKGILKDSIKNYYENKLADSQREFKKNGVLSAIFTVLAVIVLTVAVLIDVFMETHLVLQEIIDIIGWVFMWEAADMFFLQRGALRIKQIRYLNFINAQI